MAANAILENAHSLRVFATICQRQVSPLVATVPVDARCSDVHLSLSSHDGSVFVMQVPVMIFVTFGTCLRSECCMPTRMRLALDVHFWVYQTAYSISH